jgi:pimeloyl-ACP methyl ester carboxylesterase
MSTDHNPIFKSRDGEVRFSAAYNTILGQWPASFSERNVLTRFGSTHVIDSGPRDAEPVVLLHGSFGNGMMWHPVATKLNSHYRTYALDTIGDLGKSVPIRMPASRSDYAEWLVDVFDRLQIDKAHIIGASFGGFLALNFALANPGRVKRLALLAPGVPFLGQPAILWGFSSLMAVLYPRPFTVRLLMQEASRRRYEKDDPVVAHRVMGIASLKLRRRWPFKPKFKKNEFGRLKAPTLLLIGDHEILYNSESALRKARRLIPNLEAEIIPDSGHALIRDQPELVYSRIQRFLENQIVNSPSHPMALS